MSDEEFLSYCDSHAETPRCGFVPAHIARLLKLSGVGDDSDIEAWLSKPIQIINCDQDQIKALVSAARENPQPQVPTP